MIYKTLDNGLQVGRIAAHDIPANWDQKAVLVRECLAREPERFGFYKTETDRVAMVSYHPMNGPDDMFVSIGTREQMQARYKELLEGEPYCNRTQKGPYLETRKGRMVKAKRVK